MEWSKTTNRSQTESAEFQVEGADPAEALYNASKPLTMDIKDLAEGKVVYDQKRQVIFYTIGFSC